MSRNRTIFTVVVLAAVCVGVVWVQYWRFRSPAPVTPETGIQILPAGPARDGMPSIDHPTFASVATADQYLKDDGLGIDVGTAGKRRFYPFQILVWHLVVNDTIDGKPVLVAFCPLCQDGGVFERTVGEAVLSFGTEGSVWDNVSLLYDRTGGTIWTAANGFALQGPLSGTRLTTLPSRIMRWKDWKTTYADGLVLARVPGADRDYTLDPYGAYALNRDIPFPINRPDSRLSVKTVVYGVSMSGVDMAFTADDLKRAGVIAEQVGDTPVVLWQDGSGVVAFDARTTNKTLTFYQLKDGQLTDRETGTLWNADGVGYSGPLKKTRLVRLPVERTFWFCWAALHQETGLYAFP